jgi:AcrR family transcriptional regulator
MGKQGSKFILVFIYISVFEYMSTSKTEPASPRRLTRAEKQHQTRERLRASAARAIGTHGVMGASVDAISEAAGYSRGAFYGNYQNKEELLLEMIVEMMGREAQAWRALVAEASDIDTMLAEVEKRMQARARETQWSVLSLELLLHAQRDATFGRSCAALLRQHCAAVADLYEAIFEKAGRVPPDEPRALAAAALAFGNGVTLQGASGVRPGDSQFAARSFMLWLKGLIAIAEPVDRHATKRSTKNGRGAPGQGTA